MMNDIHREDPDTIWKREIADEITALKLRVNVLMKRRGGARVSPSTWREMARNGLEMVQKGFGNFGYGGTIYETLRFGSDAAGDISVTLAEMNETLKHISMAQLSQAGIGQIVPTKEEGGGITLDFLLADGESPDQEPLSVRQAGATKEHKGANAWEFIPPPPYTNVVIVCAADETAPLGMRCYAEAKLPGGVRKKYPITIEEEKP